MPRTTWLAVGMTMLVASCGGMQATEMKAAAERQPLAVDFDFAREQACGSGPYQAAMTRMAHRSPELRVGNLPPGTARLRVRMVDLDAPTFQHGGGEVPVQAVAPGRQTTIPEGALGNFTGPCPPTGSDHRYEMRVEALDAGGNVLGGGTAARTCCRRFAGG